MRPPQHHNEPSSNNNPLNLHIYKEGEENFDDKILLCKLPWYKKNIDKQILNKILLTVLSIFVLLISVNLVISETDAAERSSIITLSVPHTTSKDNPIISSSTIKSSENFEDSINKHYQKEINKQNFLCLIISFSVSFFLLMFCHWIKVGIGSIGGIPDSGKFFK